MGGLCRRFDPPNPKKRPLAHGLSFHARKPTLSALNSGNVFQITNTALVYTILDVPFVLICSWLFTTRRIADYITVGSFSVHKSPQSSGSPQFYRKISILGVSWSSYLSEGLWPSLTLHSFAASLLLETPNPGMIIFFAIVWHQFLDLSRSFSCVSARRQGCWFIWFFWKKPKTNGFFKKTQINQVFLGFFWF